MVRLSQLRRTGGSILLSVLGVLALTGSLPRLAFSSTLPACLTESSGTAWLGVHLRLLAHSSSCPEGSYAPGPHYAEIAQFSVVLSLSALIAGLAMLAVGLGFGWWALRALAAARSWLRRRVTADRPVVTPSTAVRPPLQAFIADLRAAVLTGLRLLRGPPAAALA
ncbi:MAG: hypothetical protein VB036_04910 [Propionicimonas sp.]|nr:hypothetical protein [Propionicimonas sp.]